MTLQDVLLLATGSLMSITFSFFPKLKDWMDALAPNQKRGVMFVSIIVVAMIYFAAGCGGVLDPLIAPLTGGVLPSVACTETGLLDLLRAILLLTVASQGSYLAQDQLGDVAAVPPARLLTEQADGGPAAVGEVQLPHRHPPPAPRRGGGEQEREVCDRRQRCHVRTG